MESRVPLPTDNIYKFYALFGLLLFIFSFGAAIVNNQATNNQLFQIVVELETIKALPNSGVVDEVKKVVLERKLEIIKSDKRFYKHATGVVIAIATLMMLYGFDKWHKKIQPMQDEIAKLQLDKLRAEVAMLKVADRKK